MHDVWFDLKIDLISYIVYARRAAQFLKVIADSQAIQERATT